ncbi:cupin domain-containing protein [Roseovarius sp.]|uniref:cupin domain-containing protein n=1 Tax=Roseovarius sp. TaxID=1486281 RepID=UPI003A9771F4
MCKGPAAGRPRRQADAQATRVLNPGDGYYFDSRELHRFRNVGSTKAEIISAISPPSY